MFRGVMDVDLDPSVGAIEDERQYGQERCSTNNIHEYLAQGEWRRHFFATQRAAIALDRFLSPQRIPLRFEYRGDTAHLRRLLHHGRPPPHH